LQTGSRENSTQGSWLLFARRENYRRSKDKRSCRPSTGFAAIADSHFRLGKDFAPAGAVVDAHFEDYRVPTAFTFNDVF